MLLKPKKYFYTKNNVMRMIEGCREDLGIPILKSRNDGKVQYRCWGGRGNFKKEGLFIQVPKKERLELGTGDWNWKQIVKKYGNETQIDRLLNNSIVVRTDRGTVEERIPKLI